MRRILPAGLFVLLVAAPAVAQPSTIGPGDIRCPNCAVSGQKPATAAFAQFNNDCRSDRTRAGMKAALSSAAGCSWRRSAT